MAIHQNINVRVPAELAERIDEEARLESERTGLRVDRSQIVRRALIQALMPKKAKRAKI